MREWDRVTHNARCIEKEHFKHTVDEHLALNALRFEGIELH